jgi:hypothetical protein
METGLPGVESKRCLVYSYRFTASCLKRSQLINNEWELKKCSLDCKSGGYNLEGSGLKGDRLIKMIVLMAIAYTWAIFQGTKIHTLQVQKYISHYSEPRKNYRRRSTFGVGFDGEQ